MLEAAADSGAPFLVTSCGPGVSPGVQQLHSTRSTLRDAGWDADRIEAAVALLAAYGRAASGASFDDTAGWWATRQQAAFDELSALGVFVPGDEVLWGYIGRLARHDPAPALARLEAPVLAVFGGADGMVPVADSVAIHERLVPAGLLRAATFDGADHLIRIGGAFAPGYLALLSGFIRDNSGAS